TLGNSTSDTSLPMVGGVNTKLATKQDEIPAKNTNTVLTYTGVAGTVGEKGIYQDTGTYASQTDSLIDAGTFNTALKNGLDNEFVCAGYAATGECWLWSVDNTTTNTIQKSYISAVGTGVQNGTPTPENPIYPVFYKQGNMILRKVGDYADSYDATTGKITRNVGIKVLDGTENWNYTSSCFQTVITDRKIGTPIPISTHFVSATGTGASRVPDMGIGCSSANTRVWLRYDIYQGDVTQFEQFLADQYAAGTPVTIWYPLATPVEENWSETTYTANVYVPQNQSAQNQ
ncbi:MAG: hypothetical protein J5714_01355, partial [Alphaproteobacteria bacterium]|nr:hypothetical protein [Alphaproteobacteria bacterium]